MTISLCGFVESTDTRETPADHVAVHVRFPAAYSAFPVTFFVPEEKAQHWPAGATVNLTAWASPKLKPEPPGAQEAKPNAK